MPTWLTAKEAYTHLKLSKSRFYQLVRAGKIVGYQLASQGDLRFSQEELDALLKPATKDQGTDAP